MLPEPGNMVMARIGDCDLLVEAVDVGGVSEVGLRDAVSTEAVWRTLEEVTHAIQNVWDKVKPTQAQVEFGLACALKTGALHSVLVSGSTNANFKITLSWTASPAPSAPSAPAAVSAGAQGPEGRSTADQSAAG